IERYAIRILLGAGWEYSRGCTFEYLTAIRSGIEAFDAEFRPIALERGMAAIAVAIACMKGVGQDSGFLETIWRELSRLSPAGGPVMNGAHSFVSSGGDLHFKDAVLDRLAESANVAQFVSFDPNLNQRHSRVNGFPPNHRFEDASEAVHSLMAASPEGLV